MSDKHRGKDVQIYNQDIIFLPNQSPHTRQGLGDIVDLMEAKGSTQLQAGPCSGEGSVIKGIIRSREETTAAWVTGGIKVL